MSAIGMHKRENTFMYHDYTIEGRVWEFPIGPVDPWDEAIADDLEMFPPVHIHVSNTSRDCDGGHGYDYIVWPSKRDNYTAEDVAHHVERERESLPGTFSLEKFWANEVHNLLSLWAVQTKLEIEREGEYDRRANSWSPNDEGGFSATELMMCTDSTCIGEKARVYDQYAEMEGY